MLITGKYAVWNYTPHKMDFYPAQPYSMRKPRVMYTVPSDGAIDVVYYNNCVDIFGVHRVLPTATIASEDLHLLQQRIEEGRRQGLFTIIYVSRVVVEALGVIGYPMTDGRSYVIGSIVPATKRTVKRKVASWRYVSGAYEHAVSSHIA